MFITLQDCLINIEEIRNVSTNSGSSPMLRIYFKKPVSPTDWLTFYYSNDKDLKNDFKALTEACQEYNKTKIKN
jgi:hypothetical protein